MHLHTVESSDLGLLHVWKPVWLLYLRIDYRDSATTNRTDYGKAVLELEAAMKDPEVAKAVEEVDTAVSTDAKLAEAVKAFANKLQSQPPTVQNFGKIAEEIKEIKAFFQIGVGNFYGGINIS